MGLDITAYRNLTKVEGAELDEDGSPADWRTQWRCRDYDIEQTESHWPGRTLGVNPGVYIYADSHEFRAGSYGGYGEWRDTLARLAGYGAAARSVWDDPSLSGPFVELINFSDCEGVIGPVVSAKLARDFQEHEAAIFAKAEEWFADRYRHWRKAFELAADNGAVDFH